MGKSSGQLRRPRRSGPDGAPLLRDPVLLTLGAVGVLGLTWYLLPAVGTPVKILFFWPVQVVLDLVMCVGAWRVRRVAHQPAATRRFWLAFAVSAACFTVGDVSQSLVAAADPVPAVVGGGTFQMIMIALGIGVAVVTMLTHPIEAVGRERLRFWLDAATVMAGVAVFIWTFSLSGVASADRTTSLLIIVGSALTLIAGFAVVKLGLSGHAPFHRPAALVGILGLVLTATATGVGGHLLATDPQIAMAVSYLPCVLMASVPRVQELLVRSSATTAAARQRRPYSLTPYLAVAATLGLLAVVLRGAGLDSREWGTVVGVVAIMALVVARQLAAFVDNATLVRRLRHQEQRFRSLVQYASDITVLADADGVVSYVSPAIQAVLGFPPDQVVGRPLCSLSHDGGWEFDHTAAGTTTRQIRVRHADGSWRWLEMVSTNRLDDPSVRGIICNARDVTEARALHDQLRHDATHDGLTGLANRALFYQRLAAGHAAGHVVGVLAIDLDDFKQINDTYGHHVGDGILVTVGQRLRGCLRASDVAARLGGDEFAVILDPTTPEAAETTARRVLAVITEPAVVEGHRLEIRASVGVAFGSHEADLVRCADDAMYRAKRGGKGSFAVASAG